MKIIGSIQNLFQMFRLEKLSWFLPYGTQVEKEKISNLDTEAMY